MCISDLLIITALLMQNPSVNIPEVRTIVGEKEISRMLERGGIVIIHKKPNPDSPQFISAGAIVNASKDIIWSVLTDFEHYPEFMPQTEKVTIKSSRDNELSIAYSLYFKFTVIKLRVNYVLRTFLQPRDGIWWMLQEGEENDITATYGRWELIPIAKNRIAIFYTIYSDLKSMGKLMNFFLRQQPQLELAVQVSTATLVVESVKNRAENQQVLKKNEEQVH